MKLLLFGKGGQVGWELQRSLSCLGELVALDARSTDYCGDLLRPVELAQTVEALKPDVIVNAAAYTAVDKAESEPDLARAINATAPVALAEVAAKTGAWLVHYSTDYVFDGSGQTPWQETDATAPLSVYGKTKREAEIGIAQSECKHLIFRTSWVYAGRGANFAKTMLRLAKERDRLAVIDDQVGAPTGADLLADITAHALRQVLSPTGTADFSNWNGLYHVAAGGQTSWHGYARFVLETALAAGIQLRAGKDAVDPISSSSYPTAARRPLNSRLNTHKFEQTFRLSLPAWQTGVARMILET